jgi:hypothetical protein
VKGLFLLLISLLAVEECVLRPQILSVIFPFFSPVQLKQKRKKEARKKEFLLRRVEGRALKK